MTYLLKKAGDRYIFATFIATGPAGYTLPYPYKPAEMYQRRKWMHKKLYVIAVAVCLAFLMGMTGCAKKKVRHLASDVCLVTPEITTKEQVLSYLGQPDEKSEMAEGGETWIYYDVKKSAMSGTPYIGNKIGDKKYEMVKVTFGGNIVQTCVYRLLSEEEFTEGGLAK